jgi:hypothetical protein
MAGEVKPSSGMRGRSAVAARERRAYLQACAAAVAIVAASRASAAANIAW